MIIRCHRCGEPFELVTKLPIDMDQRFHCPRDGCEGELKFVVYDEMLHLMYVPAIETITVDIHLSDDEGSEP